MTLTLNNTNTVSANNIVINGTALSDLYATINYVGTEISNINVGSGGGGGITQQGLDDAINPIIAVNDGQNLVLTDINNNLSNNFQTTTQLNINFYNKTQVDDAIEVVDTKALNNFNSINAINLNLLNNYKNNTQLNNDYYTKTEIDANNWIDNSALIGYALTSTLTNDYLTSTQISTSYYNKTEIDSNNWIDATALAPYATTATLTTNYQTNSQLATNFYNKGEVVENSKTRCNATPFVLSQICQSSQHLATLIMAFTYVHNDGTGKRVLTTLPLSESKWVTVQHASRHVPSMQDALRSETSEVKAKLTQTLGICTGQHVWVSDGECDYNNAHVLLCRLARGCAVPLSRIKDAGIGQIRALQAPS